MILVLLFGYLIFSNGLLLDMNFNKQIKILNNKIRGHKINSNKEVLKFTNGKMNEIEVSKFANKCLYLNKEYSLVHIHYLGWHSLLSIFINKKSNITIYS